MHNRWQQITSALLLFGYIATGVLLEVAHRDTERLFLQSHPLLSSHTCGAKEIHLPLDKKHECLACSQSIQRIATAAVQLLGSDPAVVSLTSILVLCEHPLPVDVFYTGKRGPPQT
jgi:hypothetical protein